MNELRDKTIRWMAGIAGDLQKQIAALEKENAQLRTENKRLRREGNHAKAMANAAGK